MPPKILIAGGTGFLGTLLARHLAPRFDVRLLSRNPAPKNSPAPIIPWDGASLGPWTRELEGSHALINLAGRSVNCRYTRKNRRDIMNSRILPTRLLAQALARCGNPPKIWLNSSTATIYRHTFGPAWTEAGEIAATPEAHDAFSIEVATAWEHEFFAPNLPHIRRAALRTAIVFGTQPATVFPILQKLTKLALGGRMGDGRQWVSWIHQTDFARAVEFILDHESLGGPVNIAAPTPITNTDMMRTLRETAGIKFALPAARWMLQLGAFVMRTETELLLKSRRVIPARLEAVGFAFQFPHFISAIRDLAARYPQKPTNPAIA